ncbi:FMN-binding protein [Streptacidiphilus pinicola]|uniref:FMN-binding protein n=1 Tax=Streptacidiphilus pinicola TaxID=2219663 RepID=A0A2X0IMK3_9ACTN|nr:FMN-binding protein [Streptacidiphilus pinicola]RAG86364.1 FMN-binding protein [Streptacidiphilus pinicola]
MRRAIVTTTATAAGVVLLLSLKPHGSQSASAQAPVISSGSDTSNTSNTGNTGSGSSSTGSSSSGSGSSAGSGSSTSAPSGTKSGSGSYTGTAVDTRYGPVQVRIDVSGGKVSKIDVLQYPNGQQRDQDINSYALPVLNQEALSAQSAQIDAVSGATYTSDGYTQSLQSALDQAGLK